MPGLGMGGGGAMYAPRISPFDSSLMFVACDMRGLYRSADGGRNWTMLDTRAVQGSNRFSVAFDPTTDGHLVGVHPVRGLMESSSAGLSWSAFSPALPQNTPVTAAGFSPDATPRLLVGTTQGVLRLAAGQWVRDQPNPAGQLHQVPTPLGDVGVHDNEVIGIAFVRDPATGQTVDLVATVNEVYAWDGQAWVPFGPATAARSVGPYIGIPDGSNYIASRVRGLAAASDGSRYVVYVSIHTKANDLSTDGGVYRLEKTASGTPAWTRDVTGLNVTPGVNETGTDAPRYEHLAVARGALDRPYVTVFNTTFVPNVYRRGGSGSWEGVYRGFPARTDSNVEAGWFEYQPPNGLDWGFGGPAKGFTVDPNDPEHSVYTNNAAVYVTTNGGGPPSSTADDWRQSYTRRVSGDPRTRPNFWQSTGLDVTSTWDYLIHPASPSVHLLCCTDIGLARSVDGGASWSSVAHADVGGARTQWNNFYEIAVDAGGGTWAAVSNHHDIPHDTQLALAPKAGAVLFSSDEGATWQKTAASGLPAGPVVSIVHRGGTLYAAVWGRGVYQAQAASGATWTAVGSGLPSNPFCHRLRFDAGGRLHCAVAGDRRTSPLRAGGLYRLNAQGQWELMTQGLATLIAPGTVAPMDFDFAPGTSDVYLCTADISGGQGGGGAYKLDGATQMWSELPIPYPRSVYWPTVTAFKPHFMGGGLYVTTISHGTWYSPNETDWFEHKALAFLGPQRMVPVGNPAAGDASVTVTTFGGAAWRLKRRAYFIANRSELSAHEVSAAPGGVVPEALYLVVDGFMARELGLTGMSAPTLTLRNRQTQQPPTQLALVNGGAIGGALTDEVQRYTFKWDLEFTGAADFAPGADNWIDVTVSVGGLTATTAIKLFHNPNPFMLDGPTPWLSHDLRTFSVVSGRPPPPGAPAFNGSTVADALGYLGTLLTQYNSASNANHPFDELPSGYGDAPLALADRAGGSAVFNFAVARVRFEPPTSATSDLLRVFFRSFKTQSASLAYQPATSYRTGSDGAGDPLPLLGLSPANEVVSVPYFDTARVDTTAAPLTTQPAPSSYQLPSGQTGEQWRFFGALLDFNQPAPRFPPSVPAGAPDGPWPSGAVSLRDLVRGQHQCLAAEISYPPDPIAPGATPESSENLAQRNLAISEAANPGSPATRTVHHTFEVRQTRPRRRTDRGQEPAWGSPDELMILWRRLPAGSRATLYMNAADTAEVVAQLRPAASGITPVDARTLELDTTQVAFVPLPRSTRTLPALLTIELPPVVRAGQRYGAVVHQVSGRTHAVLGTFELSIPVTKAPAILPRERQTLDTLRRVREAMVATADAVGEPDPWERVFARYLEQTERRVRAFEGDAGTGDGGEPGGGDRGLGCLVAAVGLALILLVVVLVLLLS